MTAPTPANTPAPSALQLYLEAFRNRRVGMLLLLGFASGLPLALTTSTLQAWATVDGVDLKTIGMLTLVGSAYTLKFLWAPLMDRYAPPIFGRRRGWMFITQILLAASIACMGLFTPRQDIAILAALAVLVAFLSASQDIAFDAYSTDVLKPQERGAGAAVKVLGYRMAMLLSGGLAWVIADKYIGWQATYMVMGALMIVAASWTYFAPEPELVVKPPRTLEAAVVQPFMDFVQRNGMSGAIGILVLIVLYKLGDAFALSLSSTFMIRGLGFSAADVGWVNKVVGLIATIVGALLGGAWLVQLGLYRSLLIFGILQAVSNLGFFLLTVLPKSLLTLASVVAFENLTSGMGTAAFVALIMGLCNVQYSATQFALLSALSAIGRTYLAGPMSGSMVETYGWGPFFVIATFIAVPGILLLIFARKWILAIEHAATPRDQVANKTG